MAGYVSEALLSQITSGQTQGLPSNYLLRDSEEVRPPAMLGIYFKNRKKFTLCFHKTT